MKTKTSPATAAPVAPAGRASGNLQCPIDDKCHRQLKIAAPTDNHSDNRQGARLLTNPFATFWVAVEEEGRTVARLFLASAYDGTRGGVPGLGWQSWQKSQLRGERGVAEELGIGSRMFAAGLVTAPSCGSPQPAMRMVRKSASSPSETISKPCWR